jgi:hypothetical protein
MGGTILYYVVGPVHPRNMRLLAEQLPDWTFHMIYESGMWWWDNRVLEAIPNEKISFSAYRFPKSLDPSEYSAVVFSTVQPRRGPIALLRWALEHKIPAIAIEESNQFGLIDGRMNNYVLPVDFLLVASSFEKQRIVATGVPEHRIKVTGWPFYSGVESVDDGLRRRRKIEMGLDPGKPVAALSLTALNDAGETPHVRRRQLTLAANGLPAEYQLVVKPHPIEKMDVLMPFVEECAPRATVVDGRGSVHDLLDGADILLNRGVSQVAIEALIHKIPVIVLSTGDKTLFHDTVPEVIVNGEDGIAAVLSRLAAKKNPLDLYGAFFAKHIPHPPMRARQLACREIVAIAKAENVEVDRAALWLDMGLYQGWQVNRRSAVKLLTEQKIGRAVEEAASLRRLLQLRADRGDLAALRRWYADGYRSYVLRCLWIDQLDRRRIPATDEDLAWMGDFPPVMNVHLFLPHCARWTRVLLRSGKRAVAEKFAANLADVYAEDQRVAATVGEMKLYMGNMLQRGEYQLRRFYKSIYQCLGTVKRIM